MSQTVLVADDSKTIRRVVQMALKASAFEVVGVGSAREAVEAAQQLPTVILLDYFMPDGSGYDVCRALKNNQSTSAIPVIMLGGTYKNFDADLARSSGAAQVVMKPFKTDDLVAAIEKAVSGAGAPAVPVAAPAPEPEPVMATPVPQSFGQPAQPPQQTQAPAPAQPPAYSQPPQSQPQPPSQPRMAPPTQTPVPESQPRIPVNSNSQSRITTSDSHSGMRPPPSTPASGAHSVSGGGAAMSRDEIQEFIREEVKSAVRAELPGLLRNVMGEVFQQKVLPKLLVHSDEKIKQSLNDQLDQRIGQQVRMELERLLAEE